MTGGASGIGLGITRALLSEGMKVAIGDVNEAYMSSAGDELAGADVIFVRTDVTDRASVAAAARQTVEAFGQIHVLCNNAGIAGGGAVADPDFGDWDRAMAVNLGGAVNVIKTFVPLIREHRSGGHVVNTSSIAGITALPHEGGAYTTAKFAVRGLSESLRLSLAPEGIGVSVLCPGLTRTRILDAPDREDPGAKPMAAEGDPDVLFNSMEGAMDPIEVGRAVVRGIRENLPYILSHGEFRDEVQMLFDEIVNAFPTDQAVPAARAEFERGRRELCDSLRHLPVID
ncbi:MAG TPA: SDR family oxidoreductase [Ilumatobacteraceae bacterium]|nr:SDR family oxidoreductase [Ilumatobacteraceae bacterium]